jgi:hypothetical protein
MSHSPVTPDRLLAEIEDLLQSKPDRATIRHDTDENNDWFGRASAIVRSWNPVKYVDFARYLERFQHRMALESGEGFRGIIAVLYEARHDLRMRTTGPINVALGQGQIFAY